MADFDPEVRPTTEAERRELPAQPGVAKASAVKRFDPHEARDHHGRWTDGGGVAAPTINADRPDHDISPSATAARRFLQGGKSPADVVTGDRVFPPQRTPQLDPVEPDLNSSRYLFEDQSAVGAFVGSTASYQLNDGLRQGDVTGLIEDESTPYTNTGDWARPLDAAMDHAGPLGEPVRVIRTVDAEDPSDLGLEPGKTLEDLGFGSTTTDPERARDTIASTTMHLHVSPDVKAIWGANPGEDELLLERGVRYHVRKVSSQLVELTGETGYLVEADVLPPRERRPMW
jgi:hypothetical protein